MHLASPETACSAQSFVDFVGVNSGNGQNDRNADGSFGYERGTNYQELLDLHIRHVRMSGPYYYITSYSADDPNFRNLAYLGSVGIRSIITTKLDPIDGYTIQPDDEAEVVKQINNVCPGAIEGVEGANEHFNNQSGIGFDFSTPAGTGAVQIPNYGDVDARKAIGKSYRTGYTYHVPIGTTCRDWITPIGQYTHDMSVALRNDRDTRSIPLIGPSVLRSTSAYPTAVKNGQFDTDIDFGNVHDYSFPYNSVKRNGSGEPGSGGWIDIRNEQESIFQHKLPLVMTETGFNTGQNRWTSVTETAQAKLIPRQLLDVFSRTAGDNPLLSDIDPKTKLYQRAYLYQLVDSGHDQITAAGTKISCRGDEGYHWGLLSATDTLDANGHVISTVLEKKPAYYALKNLMDLLYDPSTKKASLGALSYSISGDTSTVHHVLLQKSDGSFYLVLYCDVNSDYDNPTPRSNDIETSPTLPVPLTLTLSRTAKHIEVYSTEESKDILKQYTNVSKITIEVPDSPLVVRLSL
jgi:hypothetical protein